MKSRFIAFLVHLGLSALIALIAMGLVFFVWYPSPLDDAFDISGIFFLVLAVDVTMGPLMTFIVYQPLKKSLRFDLSVIALLQVMALGYGLHTIFQGRPAFVVFVQDRFEAVRAVDMDVDSQEKALAAGHDIAEPSWWAPKWVAAQKSPDTERANEILFSSIMDGGADWFQLPELYTPLIDVKARMIRKARSLQDLKALYQQRGLDLKGALDLYNEQEIKWFPLQGKTKNMIVLVDASSAKVIKAINIDPYP